MTEINCLEQFKQDMNRDWDAVIQKVFEGRMGFAGFPIEVHDASQILIQLTFSGKRTPENLKRLKEALQYQLKTYVYFSKIWTQKNPKLKELVQAWTQQTEATERWQVFTTIFKRFSDLEESLNYAFQDYPFQSLSFTNKREESIWKSMLKNQHRNLMFREGLELEPALASLLDSLFDNKAHTHKSLLQKVFGKSIVTEKERNNLSKRISTLNKLLLTQWGPPPKNQKKWIQRLKSVNWPSYQLLKR